jgi:4-amino-4-deoxy-L-arabinose transferase-like glycosyltransferase
MPNLNQNADDSRVRPLVLAGLVIAVLYAANVIYCQRSPLQYLDAFSWDSDMHSNLLWAQGIREQGWLNPAPYHPYTGWMQAIAPYSQWAKWWGGAQIYQQSPLYAYALALFIDRPLWMRISQALLSIGICIFIGLTANRLSGRRAGWIGFWLAALYAPFYLYSWPFLRDGVAWFITSVLLWVLGELIHEKWPSSRAELYAWVGGALLGLGFLAKENYILLVPITWITLAAFAWKRRDWRVLARVVIATLVAISPLLLRNGLVGAPLLSSSNRFAETFIQGNAGTAHPYLAKIPVETGQIFYQTQGRTWPIVRAVVASHPDGIVGCIKLELSKLLSLFDPYESPDNLSFYFAEHFSPLIRFGLRYWMILPLGLAGLVLGIIRRERSHIWIWLFLPIFVLNLFVGIPLSRYRQSFMIFLIPTAAYFLALVWDFVGGREFRLAIGYAVAVAIAWVLILGPLARQPRSQYERRVEYLFSAQAYYRLGDLQNERAMEDMIRQKFPGYLPPATNGPLNNK